eukprot:CAMPEP_0116015876 /NCGR_PEP_ID=MMETSP0321-20121206/7117_1 /TAXON_ID=163516 /ORGANISM="Leptocylindrus danicus var. danicus, Strain B650" /LENGTH=39 /DNA_ID= /DNA_START= /DNA_END= /DNA_ORIENTATION=
MAHATPREERNDDTRPPTSCKACRLELISPLAGADADVR